MSPQANEIFDTKAVKSDIYLLTETDEKLDLKLIIADQIDAYTKTESDSQLDVKADKTDIIEAYTKKEIDQQLDLKLNIADQIDAYNRTETGDKLGFNANVTNIVDSNTKIEYDALLLLKADKIELSNYVDLTSAQTISGQKQFRTISVSSISKLSKNDASILLAGGGDMLVSSPVTQPQLQKIRDIATGKSKAYVFSTQADLKYWMAVQDNVAKLVIEDNLYIVDKEVTDYWRDVTDLKVQETELPDMNTVIATLGAATRGGNAIN
ncbi:MAG: hypothetical protein EZS28_017794 [Streblomastix strix]|uniref:Uncharacterized protein n=1 Tax=Streblomastix strix TaxID=222440 RepID=A0A5J4VWM8_9EUKA|nr:MAG: hypothetical protein EZS28_017794 [Streblomastix strix]